MVVIVTPLLDDRACFRETQECVLIQTLIAELAVEAFDESVLNWFTGLDVVLLEPIDCPPKHRDTGEFHTVIADNGFWGSTL